MPRRKSNHLVSEHLEKVSATLLEKYQDLIRERLRGRRGIYALYKRERLYYVGLASNMRQRLNQHLKDKHMGKWDRFSIYLVVEDEHIRELESLVLRIIKPEANHQVGRLSKSRDLKRELARDLRVRQRSELSELMGRKTAFKKASRLKTPAQRAWETRRASKTALRKAGRLKSGLKRADDGKGELAEYINSRMRIRAVYKGKTYHATVRKNGWVHYNGYLYRSPSMAAKSCAKRNINGWTFWRYQEASGEWVKLRELRG